MLLDLPPDLLARVVAQSDTATQSAAAAACSTLQAAVLAAWRAPTAAAAATPGRFSDAVLPSYLDLARHDRGPPRPLRYITPGRLAARLRALTPPAPVPPAPTPLAQWWRATLALLEGHTRGARCCALGSSAAPMLAGAYWGELDAAGLPHGFGTATLAVTQHADAAVSACCFAEMSYTGSWEHGRREGIGLMEYGGGTVRVHGHFSAGRLDPGGDRWATIDLGSEGWGAGPASDPWPCAWDAAPLDAPVPVTRGELWRGPFDAIVKDRRWQAVLEAGEDADIEDAVLWGTVSQVCRDIDALDACCRRRVEQEMAADRRLRRRRPPGEPPQTGRPTPRHGLTARWRRAWAAASCGLARPTGRR